MPESIYRHSASTAPDSDHSLLEQLRARDETAFAELVRRYHRALIGLAASLAGANDAEEIVQNSWIKAHAAIENFEGRSTLRTWLSSIVLNEARMYLRKHKRECFISDLAGGDDAFLDRFNADGRWQKPPAHWDSDTPETLLMNEQLLDCLDELLRTMPDNQRAMLELRDVGGQSFASICDGLSVSASNARVLLHRARRQLYQLVDHYQETGEC